MAKLERLSEKYKNIMEGKNISFNLKFTYACILDFPRKKVIFPLM
jgi:hypothetical protein